MKFEKIKCIKKIAKANFWNFESTSRGHHKFYSPCGKHIIVVSENESNAIMTKRIISNFKRAGLVIN
jgi:hypothetical protein